MVKWLEEITVTEGESDNFYHFHDNRVLPSHVTEVLAKKEGVQRSVTPYAASPLHYHDSSSCIVRHMPLSSLEGDDTKDRAVLRLLIAEIDERMRCCQSSSLSAACGGMRRLVVQAGLHHQ